MTSYVVNPSKKVTELLSQFLEFDPEQLQLGIWSGDLSIKDVNLKADAFHPILNAALAASKPSSSSKLLAQKPPLSLKLVTGTVGHMRIQIPWSRLVWTQGDVKVDIDTVHLVLAYESKTETRHSHNISSRSIFEEEEESPDEIKELSPEEREEKQMRLREAEQHQLRGEPIPDHDAQDNKQEQDNPIAAAEELIRTGRIDSLLAQVTSSIVWRFFAGLQASIRNIRIVIVQDDIEIGVILHSLEMKAGKPCDSSSEATDPADEKSPQNLEGDAFATPTDWPLEYKGEYDDGEHVDKSIGVQGLGVYVRQIPKVQTFVPNSFSQFFQADDFVLRPSDSCLKLSFFYPHPPSKQKKKPKIAPIKEEQVKSSSVSITPSETSSKIRRGKREKSHVGNSEATTVSTVIVGEEEFGGDFGRPSLGQRSKSSMSLIPSMSDVVDTNLSHRRGQSSLSEVKSLVGHIAQNDKSFQREMSPRLELHLSFGELKTCCSSKHYNLGIMFISSVTRMRNGRPDSRIADHITLDGIDGARTLVVDAPLTRSVDALIDTSAQSDPPKSFSTPILTSSASSTLTPQTPKIPPPQQFPSAYLSPPGLKRAVTDHIPLTRKRLQLTLQLQPVRSEKSRVIASWWRYAYNNVLFEVHKKREKRATFGDTLFVFRWGRQRLYRKEYVNLYLRNRLESSGSGTVRRAVLGPNHEEERLRCIEDELNIEQIILYRSIARALRVRGVRAMEDSILCLRDRARRPRFESTFAATGDRSNISNLPKGKRNPVHQQSTGEFAVNDSTPRFSRQASIVESNDINELRQICNEIRRRRQNKKAGRNQKMASRHASSKVPEGKVKAPKGVANRKVGFTTGQAESPSENATAAARADYDESMEKNEVNERVRRASVVVDVSKSEDRSLHSFKTAKTGRTKESGSLAEAKSETQLHFTFSVKLESIELLILKDDGFIESFNKEYDAKTNASSVEVQGRERLYGTPKVDFVRDDASSGGLSQLTIDEDDFLEEAEAERLGLIPDEDDGADVPILSSTDFLTFGTPRGVILNVTMKPLHFQHIGMSGGAKKISFCVGQIDVRSEDEMQLLSVGSAASSDIAETIIDPVEGLSTERIFRRRKQQLEATETAAVEATVMQLEDQDVYMELDIAKVVLSFEKDALVDFFDFTSKTVMNLPQSLLVKSELDGVREYMLRRTKDSNLRKFLDAVHCAFRLHGVDIFFPESSFESTDSIDDRTKLKVSIGLLEFYDGALVDYIAAMHDEKTRLSAGRSRGTTLSRTRLQETFVSEQLLEFLPLNQLLNRDNSFGASHALFNVSSLCFSVESPTETTLNLTETILLQKELIDIEVLLTSHKQNFLGTEQHEATIAVSPVFFVVSKRRIDALSKILACHSPAPKKAVSEKTASAVPRLEALATQVLFSVDTTVKTLALALVNDNEHESKLSPVEREVVMEESISDYLSFLSCFDGKSPFDEAEKSAKRICIDRLVGIGFQRIDAEECAHAARRQFYEAIDLVRNTQMEALFELSRDRESLYQGGVDATHSTPGRQDDHITSDSESFMEDNSQESLDILETALQSAVEQSVAEYGSVLYELSEELTSECMKLDVREGLKIGHTKYFYDSYWMIGISSLSVLADSGLCLLSVGKDHENVTSDNFIHEIRQQDRDAVHVQFFQVDSDCEFASGGSPLSVLVDDEYAVERQRETLSDVAIRKIDAVFCAETTSRIVKEVRDIFSFSETEVVADAPQQSTPKAPRSKKGMSSVYADVVTFRVLVLSDDLMPFSQLTWSNLSAQVTESVAVESHSLSLLNLTPEGQYYPRVIYPLEMSENLPSFRLNYVLPTASPHEKTGVTVELQASRILVVRQFVNEIVQFLTSPDHGISRLTRGGSSKSGVNIDTENKRLYYRVLISKSSVLLPRTSTSIDMVAVESDSIEIFNSYHKDTFTVPDSKRGLNKGTPVSSSRTWTDSRYSFGSFASDSSVAQDCESSDKTFSTTSSFGDDGDRFDGEFFDCVESHPRPDSKAIREAALIQRVNVRVAHADLFTSLPPHEASSIPTDSVKQVGLNNVYGRFDGRAKNGKTVFLPADTQPHGSKMADDHATGRVWSCISNRSTTLEILVDYAPHLRLLITDNVQGRDTPAPLDLDMKRSEFYLLLSIWYGNMQELPVTFPYSKKVIKKSATFVRPPPHFPEYGTTGFVEWLKTLPMIRSEIVCDFWSLSLNCSFDPPSYFGVDSTSSKYIPPKFYDCENNRTLLRIQLKRSVIHVTSDENGILRVGAGACAFSVEDNRKEAPLSRVFDVPSKKPDMTENGAEHGWADFFWGLDLNGTSLASEGFPLPFQASIFLTPSWVVVNLGVEDPDAVMFDFTPIWILLDYFSGYFSDPAYGNPSFEAESAKEHLKTKLSKKSDHRPAAGSNHGLNIDFRLWLLRPYLCVPSPLLRINAPSLRISSRTGFWLNYKSMGSFTSQDMGSTNLALRFGKSFQRPSVSRQNFRGRWQNKSQNQGETLVEGLSFGLRMDFNTSTNHTDYAFCMPMFVPPHNDPELRCSLTSNVLEVVPLSLCPPTICNPVPRLTRNLSDSICEVVCIVEALPHASTLMTQLLTGAVGEDLPPIKSRGANDTSGQAKTEQSIALNCHIESFRLFLIDPILGMHLPMAVLTLSSLKLTVSKLSCSESATRYPRYISPPSDLQIMVQLILWADNFKLGSTRSWEPCLEPFSCQVLSEKSVRRGQGLTLLSDVPFHFNVTSALLLTLEDAVASLTRAVVESFHQASTGTAPTPPIREQVNLELKAVNQTVNVGNRTIEVKHQIPLPIENDRVAFSLLNLSGQRIRVHHVLPRPGSNDEVSSHISYLRHAETTRLEFQATISVVRNLKMVEVPFPGLPMSDRDTRSEDSMPHVIDVQLPGFRWLHGLNVDESGRRFDNLIPRSPIVQLKTSKDWRLANTMKLLTEVGFDNGGRLITVRGLFEVRNHTSHDIVLNLHPSPTNKPHGFGRAKDRHRVPEPEGGYPSAEVSLEHDTAVLAPGDGFQIPLLLLESALRLDGGHLGSLWVRPSKSDNNQDLFESLALDEDLGVQDPVIGYSSRPIQLAKVVDESAMLFKAKNGEDLSPDKVRSGIQVSCPIANGDDGVPVAPFCYAIEIRRSPVVRDPRDFEDGRDKKVSFASTRNLLRTPSDRKTQKMKREDRFTHSPVAYTLMVHPPIIVENLLPARGRFELMHAVRRTVLWFADLKPGEKVPVHSVGLDAPLLLLVNLGFSRTPVGEGALIHHGSDVKGMSSHPQGGFKSISKAVSKGTKQIGKTLTTIGDSPDHRGQGKLFLVQNPQFLRANKLGSFHTPALGGSLGLDTEGAGTDSAEANVHMVDNRAYTQDEISTETVVVDSVGQKLTLRIENVRGGGGQRRVSLFCPFWMVNTTEHALRYRQEKSTSYVSGTVSSPSVDGSKPVDGLKPQYNSSRRLTDESLNNQDTVFGGQPGPLAPSPGQCSFPRDRLMKLLEQDLPLSDLASLAFMFNFHEDLLLPLGKERLVVQLADGTGCSPYISDWSHGFSLESVGVPQLIGMHCKDGRILELSVTVSVAPGFLSGYTKIVRFTPRFVVLNRLKQPVRIWQDSSLLHSVYENQAHHEGFSKKFGEKWHMKERNGADIQKVNQYELVFGRPAAVEETAINGVPMGTTAPKSALYIATVGSEDLFPFHLPDTRGDRQFRIDLGSKWNLTSSFNADSTGEHTLKVTKALDLRLLKHVNTRASPHYQVTLPPADVLNWDGELGVWFETSWGGDRKILVKGTKRSKHAFNNTDIRVGDELLKVDNIAVSQLTFTETMKLLKERLAYVAVTHRRANEFVSRRRGRGSIIQSLTRTWNEEAVEDLGTEPTTVSLTFRTLEERLRRVRLKASKTKSSLQLRSRSILAGNVTNDASVTEIEDEELEYGEARSELVKVEMRAIHNSVFMVIRDQDSDSPPYRIDNRAMNYFIFYRQRGCDAYPWNILQPGESSIYCWEEPLKPHKLTVCVGIINIHLHGEDSQDEIGSIALEDGSETNDDRTERKALRKAKLMQSLNFQYIDSEDRNGFGGATTVKLEEIGFETELPCPQSGILSSSSGTLKCHVASNGATRVLIVSSSDKGGREERNILQKHINTLEKFTRQERDRIRTFRDLKSTLGSHLRPRSGSEPRLRCDSTEDPLFQQTGSQDSVIQNVENEATALADFPDDSTICRCNQLVIQINEVAGLKPAVVGGLCSPYCEVVMKGPAKRKRSLLRPSLAIKRSYYVEKTSAAKWIGQTFVFDVSKEAALSTRGHTVQVRVRHFRLTGYHPYLGQANVHLRSLRNQQELTGWYPLVGRTGRQELEDSQANWGRGSVNVRVQWIYSVPALVDYFLMLSEKRLGELRKTIEGMNDQLQKVIESDVVVRNRLQKHELTKEMLKDPFGIASRLLSKPTPMKKGRQTVSSQKGLKSFSVTEANDRSEEGQSLNKWSIQEPMKNSRDMLMWLLYLKTAESRHTRKLNQSKASDTETGSSLEATRKIAPIAPGEKLDIILEGRQDDGMVCDENNEQMVPHTDDFSVDRNLPVRLFEAKPTSPGHDRQRSASFDALSFAPEIFEFSKRAGPFRRADVDDKNTSAWFDGDASNAGNLIASTIEGNAERDRIVSLLTGRGLVHNKKSPFHVSHLGYHFRSAVAERTLRSDNRPKSLQRVSESRGNFKTWLTAQAVFNDRTLTTAVAPNKFEISLLDHHHQRRVTMDESPVEDNSFSRYDVVLEKVGIPTNATQAIQSRLEDRAKKLSTARSTFERSCKRSLRTVLNPGGWLTVRPITALNLPDAHATMSVKLRYGAFSLSTNSVDSKAVPVWTVENAMNPAQMGSPSSRAMPGRRSTRTPNRVPSFDGEESSEAFLLENDLSIPIDSQRASGAIRLAVVGERLNTKVEIGVLEIPLGAAIRCCIESDENALDGAGDCGPDPACPMYIRWFPLLNPKDTIPISGDMGYSLRPKSTEKESELPFSKDFSPCIKLALIWQPRHEQDCDSGNLDTLFRQASVRSDTWHDHLDKQLITNYFTADVCRVSCSLIDSQRALELASLSLSDINIRYSVSKAKTRLGFVVGWIQVDHQVHGSREPVVLAPTPVIQPQPTLQFLAFKDNLRSRGEVESYELVGLFLEELDVSIEESWVFEVWEFLLSVVRRREGKKRSNQSKSARSMGEKAELTTNMKFKNAEEFQRQTLLEALYQDDSLDEKIYVEKLYLGPVKINLSYVKGRQSDKTWERFESLPDIVLSAGAGVLGLGEDIQHFSETLAKWCEFTHDEDMWTESGEAKSSVNLPNIIASVLPSVSEAPIRLQGKGITFIFETKTEIFNSVKNYYVNETLKQIYKIVGSLDFVGNPTMVLNSFATGVRDFFLTPSREFLKTPGNPSRLGIGVAKGTLSLFSHSASGFFGFASKVTATVGQAAATLSLDADYQRWHRDLIVAEAKNLDRKWKRTGTGGFSNALGRPFFDVARGFALGVTGLIVSPIKGAKEEGGVGFIKGVAVGTAGAVTKPIVGIFDAFSHVTGSIHDVAKSVNVLEKRFQPSTLIRLPYTFGFRNVLVPFDTVVSRNVSLLRKFPSKLLREKDTSLLLQEVHIASEVLLMEPDEETVLIVSTVRIVLLKIRKDVTGAFITTLCWEVPFREAHKISSRVQDHGHNGVALTIASYPPSESTANSEDGLPLTRSETAVEDKLGHSISDDLPFEEGEDFPTESPLKGSPSKEHESNRTFGSRLTNQLSTDAVYRWAATSVGNSDKVQWYSVLAEYNHRLQLSRIHNAICCVTGNHSGIIWARGLGHEHGGEGYRGFGEFFFTLNDESRQKSDTISRVERDALETLPWIPETFFDDCRGLSEGEVHTRFMTMRKNWTLAKEAETTQIYGGPKWLLDARAEAMFVAEDAPQIPAPIPISKCLQDIRMNLYKGDISYQEAAASTEKAIERGLQLLHTHQGPLRQLESIGDSYSPSLFSTATSMQELSLEGKTETSYPSVGGRRSLKTLASDGTISSDAFMSAKEFGSVSPLSSLGRNSTKTSLDHYEVPLSAEIVDASPAVVERTKSSLPNSQPLHGSIQEDPREQLSSNDESSEELESVNQVAPESRMDRVEMMMEKLLEVSLHAARSPPIAATSATTSEEIAELRSQLQSQQKQENETVEQLRSEIAELRQLLVTKENDGSFGQNRKTEDEIPREIGGSITQPISKVRPRPRLGKRLSILLRRGGSKIESKGEANEKEHDEIDADSVGDLLEMAGGIRDGAEADGSADLYELGANFSDDEGN